MLLLNDIISDEEILSFGQYFADNYDKKKYINWQSNDEIIDHRLVIDQDCPLFKIIQRIVRGNFDKPVDVWSAYQRQSRPHEIHIDDYMSNRVGYFRYTYILAMQTVPEFKSIVWKETCWDNDKLAEFVHQWGRTRRFQKSVSCISREQDLEHTYDKNQEAYMADYLTPDGIYTYKKGTACLFDATKLHCSSNWLKYPQFPNRELLQIHVLNATAIDC